MAKAKARKFYPAGMICRASITLPNGEVIYARDYGKKAFCFVPGTKAKAPTGVSAST